MNRGRNSRTEAEMLSWLLEHVRIDDDGCRMWAGVLSTRSLGPVVNWNYKRLLARRLLMKLLGHEIEGKVVYALCGKAACMNPKCLRVGTRRQSIRNQVRNGNVMRGARRSMVSAMGRAPGAKLPASERDTVMRLRGQGENWTAIGRRYGVSGDAVSKAVKAWERAGLLWGMAA